MKELARLVANNQTLFKCEQCGEEMTSYFPFIEVLYFQNILL